MRDIKPKWVRLSPQTPALIEAVLGGPLPHDELAAQWKTSRASVSRWLRGKTKMPIHAAEELAGLLGLPLQQLIHPVLPLHVQGQEDAWQQETLKRFAKLLGVKPHDNVNARTVAALFAPLLQPWS